MSINVPSTSSITTFATANLLLRNASWPSLRDGNFEVYEMNEDGSNPIGVANTRTEPEPLFMPARKHRFGRCASSVRMYAARVVRDEPALIPLVHNGRKKRPEESVTFGF